MPQLQARLHAIGGIHTPKFIANYTVGRLKKNIKHKTSHTSGTIHVASVTEHSALIVGNAVASYLDTGTGLYGPRHKRITPAAAQALRWIGGGPSKVRLSGRSRMSHGKALGNAIFARSTKGMRAQPYVARSLVEAKTHLGQEFGTQVIHAWDEAS